MSLKPNRSECLQLWNHFIAIITITELAVSRRLGSARLSKNQKTNIYVGDDIWVRAGGNVFILLWLKLDSAFCLGEANCCTFYGYESANTEDALTPNVARNIYFGDSRITCDLSYSAYPSDVRATIRLYMLRAIWLYKRRSSLWVKSDQKHLRLYLPSFGKKSSKLEKI